MKIRFFQDKSANSSQQKKQEEVLDFIIVGAEKAGTSYISSTLRSSEQIHMPEQEVRFFRDPFYPERERLDDFLGEKGSRKAGIKHPSYLGRPEVPARIHQHNPQAKLIFLLRDPVERAISSYLHYIRHGQVPLIHPDEGLQAAIAQKDGNKNSSSKDFPKYSDILEFGLYHKYINLYDKLFGRDKLLILEYESFLNGKADMRLVTDFLEIEPIECPPPSRINQGSYDWSRCVLDYTRALAFNRFDESMNIIEIANHPHLAYLDEHYQVLRKSLPPAPIEISKNTRKLLADYYKQDIESLKKDGYLNPRNW